MRALLLGIVLLGGCCTYRPLPPPDTNEVTPEEQRQMDDAEWYGHTHP